MSDARLEEYRAKRDFERTPEPEAGETAGDEQRFVIQKHDATRLHYDFRIEADGVLLSWAVPKGPATDPREKRLAVRTEDHPLDYLDFEGVIPEDEYGGGAVIVWDTGTYRNLSEQPVPAAVDKGHVRVWLEGEKLRGAYDLVHAKLGGEEKNWLLRKVDDEGADARRNPTSTQPESVLTGRTLEQVAEEEAGKPGNPGLLDLLDEPLRDLLREEERPEFREPMLATLADEPFSDPDWIFEPKLDGVRLIAVRDSDRVDLYSRKGKRQNATYPEIRDAVAGLDRDRIVLDGEVVAFEGGRPSFARLQGRMQLQDERRARSSGIPVFWYVFDLLHLDGYDTTRLPLRDRKELLRQAVAFADPLRFSTHRNEHGVELYNEACRQGWEGLIAKRADSAYRAGRRSRDWLKLKCVRRQEFVVGGFTAPKGTRTGFGALLVGYHENGRLRYAGKVGTGYDETTLRTLHKTLGDLETDSAPFDEPVREKSARWVEPALVCEVGFSEWTDDGKLRHPRFLGLRDDKHPSEVVREEPTR